MQVVCYINHDTLCVKQIDCITYVISKLFYQPRRFLHTSYLKLNGSYLEHVSSNLLPYAVCLLHQSCHLPKTD